MKFSKLIKKFNDTGVCEIHIEDVVKHWDDKYSISEWSDDVKCEFTLIKIGGKNNKLCLGKIGISVDDANELIKRLGLLRVQSFMRSGKTWTNKENVLKEIKTIEEQLYRTQMETGMLKQSLLRSKNALL